MITIRHGVNNVQSDALAGQTVEQIRDQFAEALNIPGEAQVRLNGLAAGNDAVVNDDATVEFVKAAGEKGQGR